MCRSFCFELHWRMAIEEDCTVMKRLEGMVLAGRQVSSIVLHTIASNRV